MLRRGTGILACFAVAWISIGPVVQHRLSHHLTEVHHRHTWACVSDALETEASDEAGAGTDSFQEGSCEALELTKILGRHEVSSSWTFFLDSPVLYDPQKYFDFSSDFQPSILFGLVKSHGPPSV